MKNFYEADGEFQCGHVRFVMVTRILLTIDRRVCIVHHDLCVKTVYYMFSLFLYGNINNRAGRWGVQEALPNRASKNYGPQKKL